MISVFREVTPTVFKSSGSENFHRDGRGVDNFQCSVLLPQINGEMSIAMIKLHGLQGKEI